MTQKLKTTVEILIRCSIPPGANAAMIANYISSAIKSWGGGLDPQDPLFNFNDHVEAVKLVKKETLYK